LAQPSEAVTGAEATPDDLAVTGCPHFRQNSEPGGRFAAHWLHNTADSFPMQKEQQILAQAIGPTLVGEARFRMTFINSSKG
jgi:hypothetical protein